MKLCDPLSISQSKCTDDISKWPKVDLGCIFGYIFICQYPSINDCIQASMTVSDTKNVWIIVQKNPVEILTCWISRMAGSSKCCNDVIALLYKVDYANKKGYLDPLCTSMPCNWNKTTKREIEPKMVRDIIIPKKLDQILRLQRMMLIGKKTVQRPTRVQSSFACISKHIGRFCINASSQFT